MKRLGPSRLRTRSRRRPSSTRLAAVLGSSLLCAAPSGVLLAQAPAAPAAATQVLLEKAHTLEARGRMDMASQTWQQVLLSDPNNTEALGGLARAAKAAGNQTLANSYLERVRAINPSDPGLTRAARADQAAEKAADKTVKDQGQTEQLRQAGQYAQAGDYAQAMALYRKAFGDQPPAGDWALAYYETEAATEAGRPHAVAGLHALIERYPADSRYQIALGRILTYNPRTRAEGRRYLERHPGSPQAMQALRQSLVWDSANPAFAPEIRAYLAKHKDPELAEALAKQPKASTAKPSAATHADNTAVTGEQESVAEAPAAETAEVLADRKAGADMEQAYKALNAKRLDDADARFKAILADHPDSARALAGLGYVRMNQSNFGAAISFLEQAKQNGAKDAGLAPALDTARFWFTVGEGTTALNNNDLTTAEQKFQEALNLKPNNPEATEGLAGTLLKAQQNDAAAQVFERVVKLKPSSATAWRGLFSSYYLAGNAAQALATEHRIPPAVHAQLMRDPDFLRNLASAYSAVGRDADAQRVLRSALDLPFPADASHLKVETQLQYASLLQAANHLDQAAGLYRQVLAAEMGSAPAWEGLVRVDHAMKADAQALQTLSSMPPSVYEASMKDVGFASTVASIYQATNHLDTAQAILEQAVRNETASNVKPSIGLELQLAGIYLSRNNTAAAYPIYRQVLAENPDRSDAWKGILSALHTAGKDQEALAQAQQVPAGVRNQLESDPEYLQTIGSIYNGLGQPQQAMVFISRVQQHYAAQNSTAPADIDIQDAWLLFNSGNDAGLYRQLMLLGGRPDLSVEQRRTVQTIWTNWAVRRANQAAARGDQKRSLAILNAAAKAFPDNPGVLRALASGYARAGLPRQAVLIYKSQDMSAATASDYKSAVGAALAVNDQKSAETWLRYALDAYPKDSQILTLGAKFEQAHGNNNRAADYFRASLAAQPPGDPGAELAGELSQPAPPARLPSATQSQDLATLLSGSGDGEPSSTAQGDSRPYLPNYGNVSGEPPVPVGGASYTGQPVVPSYMANPASRLPSTPRTGGTLGSYSPQTHVDTVPAAATPSAGHLSEATAPTYTPPLTTVPVTPARQAPPLAVAADRPSLAPPAAVAPSAIYSPYASDSSQHTAPAYAPSPVSVALGNGTPVPQPTQREVTDVLPTQKYLPNAPFQPAPQTTNVSQNTQPGIGQQYPQPDVIPGAGSASSSGTGTPSHRRRSYSSTMASGEAASPAYGSSTAPPLAYPNVRPSLSSQPYPALSGSAPESTPPPTDADLAAKNLPPLRGSYEPAAVVPATSTERERTEQELAALEASYSGWIGGTGVARYRSGVPGLDRLIDIEAPVEASIVLGKAVRLSVIPNPVFLNSGNIDTVSAQNAASNGGTTVFLGSLPTNASSTPVQQFSSGIGGSLQLNSTHLGIDVGYTPYNFLVSNITGHAQIRLGHFTLFGDRDSVKDTQLSYAGLRDPGSINALYSGNIWGGVISSTGGARIDVGGEKSGFYLSADGGPVTGYHVLDNNKYEGTMGAYFRVHRWPGYGTLNVGGNFFAMHYDQNERGMSYGLGGYFSPNVYFLASLPFTYTGLYGSDFHYSINGAVGVQTFQEASQAYFPLDRALQSGAGNAYYGLNSSTGLNYSLNFEGSYRIADHWYAGAFASANNTRNYNTVNGGFFVRYLFRQQAPTEDYPTGLFPVTGFRPLRVP